MRAPGPSFRSELAAFRKLFVSENEDSPPFRFVLEILDRWRDSDAAEKIWSNLKTKLPAEAMPTAHEFIWLVVQRRLLLARLDNSIKEMPTVTSKTKFMAKRYLRENRFAQLSIEAGLVNEMIERRTELLGRQGNGQQLFIKGWREKFKELCGQPLDQIVGALTQIAYGGEAPSKSAVRGTERPTTRAERDTRLPK